MSSNRRVPQDTIFRRLLGARTNSKEDETQPMYAAQVSSQLHPPAHYSAQGMTLVVGNCEDGAVGVGSIILDDLERLDSARVINSLGAAFNE